MLTVKHVQILEIKIIKYVINNANYNYQHFAIHFISLRYILYNIKYIFNIFDILMFYRDYVMNKYVNIIFVD